MQEIELIALPSNRQFSISVPFAYPSSEINKIREKVVDVVSALPYNEFLWEHVKNLKWVSENENQSVCLCGTLYIVLFSVKFVWFQLQYF